MGSDFASLDNAELFEEIDNIVNTQIGRHAGNVNRSLQESLLIIGRFDISEMSLSLQMIWKVIFSDLDVTNITEFLHVAVYSRNMKSLRNIWIEKKKCERCFS